MTHKRTFIVFSLSSSSLVSTDPCGRGGAREHLHERTRTDGTEPARHPPPEVVLASAGRGGAARPPWIPRNRLKPEPLRERSEEHTSEPQPPMYLVCRLLLEKK